MASLCFERAVFVKSVVEWSNLPTDGQPEVAFVGRSNAGKSSALNVLANRTRLAFVSKTPGRTRELNFFQLPAGGYVVDLPGYGYAKTARATKTDWGPLLGRYVRERTSLQGVVMLMDIRHALSVGDEAFLEWYAPAGRGLIVLLTKADKVGNQVRVETARAVRAGIAKMDAGLAERTQIIVFSSPKRIGLEATSEAVRAWLPKSAPPTEAIPQT
jgi:GTP-binding protein